MRNILPLLIVSLTFQLELSAQSVRFGGEVNRLTPSTADLLPFSYGTVIREDNSFTGLGNSTLDFSDPNFVLDTFVSTDNDFSEISITITAKRQKDQTINFTIPNYAYAVLPLVPGRGPHHFEVILLDENEDFA